MRGSFPGRDTLPRLTLLTSPELQVAWGQTVEAQQGRGAGVTLDIERVQAPGGPHWREGPC